jgi:Protein of unknown function (DUF2752)
MTKPGTELHWLLASALVATVVVSGVVLYCFDPSQGGIYPVCLFHRMTGLMCPGCGSLRAIHQLLHGHLGSAFQFNPLLIISMPLGLWFGLAARRRGGTRAAVAEGAGGVSGGWLWLCLGLGLAFTVWRNIPGTFFWNLPK